MSIVAPALFLLLPFAQIQAAPASQELFTDSAFENGFLLSSPSSAAPPLGILKTQNKPNPQPPAWRLDQWATRYPLQPGICKPLEYGGWEVENAGKRVLCQHSVQGGASMLLRVRGTAEYAGHLRKEGEAWPHLLIERCFESPVRLRSVSRMPLTAEMRIVTCQPDPNTFLEFDPDLHTAQVSMYWTLHNITKGNPDYQEMIWFGIPFFDARYNVPPPHYAIDSGKKDASQKFICLLDGQRFWTGRTGDGQWRKLEVDLASLLLEGIAIAKQHGHFQNTNPEDVAITTFNFGWEVTGPFDAAMEFRNLSLKTISP